MGFSVSRAIVSTALAPVGQLPDLAVPQRHQGHLGRGEDAADQDEDQDQRDVEQHRAHERVRTFLVSSVGRAAHPCSVVNRRQVPGLVRRANALPSRRAGRLDGPMTGPAPPPAADRPGVSRTACRSWSTRSPGSRCGRPPPTTCRRSSSRAGTRRRSAGRPACPTPPGGYSLRRRRGLPRAGPDRLERRQAR